MSFAFIIKKVEGKGFGSLLWLSTTYSNVLKIYVNYLESHQQGLDSVCKYMEKKRSGQIKYKNIQIINLHNVANEVSYTCKF